MSSLRLDKVAVSYGKQIALGPFTDLVATGEWLGIIGPNGAGKSSLIRAIAGLVRSEGLMEVDGRSLHGINDRQRAQLIAYVAQDPQVPDDMTVLDYVLLGRTPYVGYFGNFSRTDRQVVADVLERLLLSDFAGRFLGKLSGGERQRVVLARALAQDAPVLLLDEPTSALDIGYQQQALELVTELRIERGLTVVSAMHDLTLAATYTDRLTMLDHGEVVATGAAAEVLTAERLGEVYHVCVTVEIDKDDDMVIVVPRRGFPVG